MFESSHPFAFFDYFRVPYQVTDHAAKEAPAGLGRLRAANGRSLLWARTGTGAEGIYRMAGMPVAGAVRRDAPGPGWRPTMPIVDGDGRRVASIWVDDEGNVFLPFDPGEVMLNLWSERYTRFGRAAAMRHLRRLLIRGYYAIRPALPRRLQLRMRRAFAARQTVPHFPAWPAEHGLHELYAWLFATAAHVALAPVPFLDPWPDGRSWALVLTHDVETHVGYADMDLLRDPERLYGYRSSWNFVGERYEVGNDTVARLRDEGCEIGVHGLRHDGRDLASRRLLLRRLPAMRAYAARWGAVGFRSPATQRSWDLMRLLVFRYDTSYTDTDPYEPQPGGCCTYLPYFNGDLVELPITLPQDHTLFEILDHADGKLWIEKARELRDRGGMVLVLAHPDYARDARIAASWQALLAEFAADETVWQALPRDVAAWWHERAESTLVRGDGNWVVSGPAAERGRVRLWAP